MVAKNDITGDSIQTRGTSQKYLDNYDLIFRKKSKNSDIDNVKETEHAEETETGSNDN